MTEGRQKRLQLSNKIFINTANNSDPILQKLRNTVSVFTTNKSLVQSGRNRCYKITSCVMQHKKRFVKKKIPPIVFCTPLTAVINFQSRYLFLIVFATKPDTQDYYFFLEFSQSVISPIVELAWLGKLKDQWERILLLKTVFYTFSSYKIGK